MTVGPPFRRSEIPAVIGPSQGIVRTALSVGGSNATTRFYQGNYGISGRLAARSARSTAEGARDWVPRQQVAGCGGEPSDRISPRLEGGWLCRGRKHRNCISMGRE